MSKKGKKRLLWIICSIGLLVLAIYIIDPLPKFIRYQINNNKSA